MGLRDQVKTPCGEGEGDALVHMEGVELRPTNALRERWVDLQQSVKEHLPRTEIVGVVLRDASKGHALRYARLTAQVSER